MKQKDTTALLAVERSEKEIEIASKEKLKSV